MELALGAMAGLAPKLGDLLMAEYVVQKGLKPDIESLSTELVMMNAALKDVSQVPPEQLSEVDKLWARKVRELSYDMEDVVDDFILRVASGNSETATDANVLKKILGKATAVMKKVKDRHQISNKVKDIKKLSNELAQLRAKYTIRGAGANFATSTGIDPRVLNLYKKESDLVGIEESRDKVIRMLSIQFSCLPINLKHLARLLHLKYLEIFDTPVDVLPEEIGHLKSLPTLILFGTGLDELPPAICLLAQLMCLDVFGFKRFPADMMGNLTSLEQLRLKSIVGRNATEDLVVALGKLTRLTLVTIIFSEGLDERLQQGLVQSLRNLRELKELDLFSEGLPQQGATVWEDWEAPRQLVRLVINGITFLRLPRWINRSRLPCLFLLSLGVYVVEVEDLDNLARLPELSHLELGGSSWPPGYTVGTDSFKNLRFCCVGTTLKFHMGAMPRLEQLQFSVYAGYWSWEVNGVPLEQFPTKDVIEDFDLGLDNLLSLEQVAVQVDCSGATAAEVQEVEAAVTRAVENHPNHLTIQMSRRLEEDILSDNDRMALLQQNIELHYSALQLKDKPDAFFILKLHWYRLLQRAVISINCAGARLPACMRWRKWKELLGVQPRLIVTIRLSS